MLINYNPDYTLYIVGTSIFAQELESWITNDITGKITSISPDEYFTLPDYSQCILGFQNIIYRKDFLLSGNRLARSWPIYIHPTAFVTDKNLINKGTVICPMAVVGYGVTIGCFGMVGIHSKLGHGDQLGDNVVISPGSNIGGTTIISNNVYFGQCSSVKDKITICSNTKFTMNSIITKSITSPGNYSGNKKIPIIINNDC